MKKAILAVLGLIVALCSNAQNITVDSTLANKYLAFGSGSVLYNDEVIQTGLNANWEHLGIGLWSSTALKGKDNLGNERDLKFSWTEMFGNVLGIQNVSSDTSVSYFNEPGLSHLGKGDMYLMVEKISAPTEFGVLALNIQNYQTMPGSGYSGGWLIGPSLARNIQISDRWSVFAKAGLNMVHGFGADEGVLAHGFVSADYEVTKDITWSILQVTPYVSLTAHDLENDKVIATAFTIKL